MRELQPIQHSYLSQRVTHTTCPQCGQDVIRFVEHGLGYLLDAVQAPNHRTPLQHHNSGRQVWRKSISTGRWRFNPGSPRGENPVHLEHVCPTVGRSQA